MDGPQWMLIDDYVSGILDENIGQEVPYSKTSSAGGAAFPVEVFAALALLGGDLVGLGGALHVVLAGPHGGDLVVLLHLHLGLW